MTSAPSNFQLLLLIIWKNWRTYLQGRKKIYLILFSPIIFSIILLILRFSVVEKAEISRDYDKIVLKKAWSQLIQEMLYRKETIQEYSEDFQYSVFVPRLMIGYAPNTSPNENIMNIAINSLEEVELRSFADCEELRETMMIQHFLAGICFNDFFSAGARDYGLYKNQLNYSIIFPSELRFYNDVYIGFGWHTHSLYEQNNKYDQRNPDANDGGYIGYIREGFASIQTAVSLAYIQLVSNTTEKFNIQMKRFPMNHVHHDHTSNIFIICLPLVLITSMIMPLFIITRQLIKERENKMNIVLQVLGVHNFVNFLAWFLCGFVILLIITLYFTIIIKIHWVANRGICSSSSFAALTFFLLIYNISALCFCYMVTSFFMQETTGLVVLAIAYYHSFLPFLIVNSTDTFPIVGIVFISFFSNSILGLAFKIIFIYEHLGVGLQWSNYFSNVQTFSVGNCTLVLIALSIMYVSIGLAVLKIRSTIHNRPKLNLLGNKSYKRYPSILRRMSRAVESQTEFKKCTVQLNNVSMNYDNERVLHNVNMEFYENEITAIMGHNASGKSTLVNILIGLEKPSKGKVIHDGVEAGKLSSTVQEGIGFYINGIGLFDELTTFEQLQFYCCIKGIFGNDCIEEINKFLNLMGPSFKIDIPIKLLTLGERNLLGACCALVGNSLTVIMDAPTVVMDSQIRRVFWEIISEEKINRTIILTTNSPEGPENYADRLAIFTQGVLKCNGSRIFLRQIYGQGYRLICSKTNVCNVQKVTEFVGRFIPYIRPECDLGLELSYIIDIENSDVITDLLRELEKNCDILELNDFCIREIALDNIFMQMGSEYPSNGERLRHSQIMNGKTIYAYEYVNRKWQFLNNPTRLRGFKRFLLQFFATLRKRYLHFIRNKCLALIQIIVPMLLVAIAYCINNHDFSPKTLEPLTFELSQYEDGICILDYSKKPTEIAKAYIQTVNSMSNNTLEIDNGILSLDDFIKNETLSRDITDMKYILGASISSDNIIAWFSNKELHIVPLSLNIIHIAILRSLLDTDANIYVSLTPLPYNITSVFKPLHMTTCLGNLLIQGLSFIWSINVIFLIKERISCYKLLQFISGLRITTYWLITFCWDMVLIVVSSVLITLTIAIFHNTHLQNLYRLLLYFVVLITNGICMISFNYIISTYICNATYGYGILITMSLFGALFYEAFFKSILIENKNTVEHSDRLYKFLRVFPQFVSSKLITSITIQNDIDYLCSDEIIKTTSNTLEQCQALPNCCLTVDEFWTYNYTEDIIVITTMVIGFWTILFLSENRKMQLSKLFINIPRNNKSSARREHIEHHLEIQQSKIFDQIIYEKTKTQIYRSRDLHRSGVVLNAVGKKQISSINLFVERGECLGIVGRNSSGKSTLLKVLVGAESMTYGEMYIEGLSVKDGFDKIYNIIGYAPQVIDYFDEFKVYEIMHMYCSLRGIPKAEAQSTCTSLAKFCGFFTHYEKEFRLCSPGIRKRISWANAVISNPSIIIMDEPDTHVDMVGKRLLVNLMRKFKQLNTTIIFTTLSTQHCERSCDRVLIFLKGRALALGSPFEIRSNHLNGFIVKIYIKRTLVYITRLSITTSSVRTTLKTILSVQNFIENEFPNAVYTDRLDFTLVYFIPHNTASITDIFNVLRRNAFHLNIEYFDINAAALNRVVLDMCEIQRKRSSE